MKKELALIIGLLFAVSCWGQDSLSMPPYKKNPIVPPFDLLTADSVRYSKASLLKNKAVLIILFNPKCDHCQLQTEEILMNIDKFKDIEIVMATGADFSEMKKFSKDYRLTLYPGITVGMETKYLLASFFDIRTLPFMAMYDKKGKLLGAHEGDLPIKAILKIYE